MREGALERNTMFGKDPCAISLEDYDVSQRKLYSSDSAWGFFDRLRKEDPVHYCKDSEFGPYWSITRFDDIMEVEGNPEIFSSEGSISIEEPDEELNVSMFIAMDEPEHSRQRGRRGAAQSGQYGRADSRAGRHHPRRATRGRNL